MFVGTYTQTHTHARTHTHTHTHIHAHTHPRIVHTSTHKHAHTRNHTHTRAGVLCRPHLDFLALTVLELDPVLAIYIYTFACIFACMCIQEKACCVDPSLIFWHSHCWYSTQRLTWKYSYLHVCVYMSRRAVSAPLWFSCARSAGVRSRTVFGAACG